MLDHTHISDELIDEIGNAVGQHHNAWDMVDPKELVAAAVRVVLQDKTPINHAWFEWAGWEQVSEDPVIFQHPADEFVQATYYADADAWDLTGCGDDVSVATVGHLRSLLFTFLEQ